MAQALTTLAGTLGLAPKIAYIDGDDLMPRLAELQAAGEAFAHLDKGIELAASQAMPITANAYLGGWGIARALEQGADIVVCGRMADAALVAGPAAPTPPAISSNAAPRPQAAIIPSSTKCRLFTTWDSPSPRFARTAASSSPSTRIPAAWSPMPSYPNGLF